MMTEKEIVYALLKKDGTRVTIKGHFIKYDGGNAMVIRTSAGGHNTVVAVVNMEACLALVDSTGIPEEPKAT